MSYKCAFLIPFYNHPRRIKELVTALSAYELPIIIVDDGSDEQSKAVLRELDGVIVVTRDSNGGKGAAMKDGFGFGLKNGFSHLFQIDADFQHDLSFVKDCLNRSKISPKSMICASPIYDQNAPKSRLYGRKITNFWIYINTLGGDIKDGMCGFRIYPLNELKDVVSKCKTNRMEFDTEILVNAYRHKVIIEWIDIKVFYEKDGVSHFKMLRDNALISLMHARCFFSLPKFIFSKFSQKKDNQMWWQRDERGGKVALNLTLFLTKYLPVNLLNFIVKFVVMFYYMFSKNERENIRIFRANLQEFVGKEYLDGSSVFSNFYEFGVAICDKFRIWRGKISQDDIKIINEETIKKELLSAKKGQIILTAHLGNIEICKALSTKSANFEMVILAYDKHNAEFSHIISKLSGKSVRVMLVNELSVESMLELKNIIDNGIHIGVMGDRVPINSDKSLIVKFLGKEAKFNYGPYLIAGILGTGISSLWCQKIDKKYEIELVKIADNIRLRRDKKSSVQPYVEAFAKELELRCQKTPSQWFNFFDFWRI